MSKKKNGGVNRVVRYFLAGLFAILPLLITVIAITWTLGFLGQLVGPETFLGKQLSNIVVPMLTHHVIVDQHDMRYADHKRSHQPLAKVDFIPGCGA